MFLSLSDTKINKYGSEDKRAFLKIGRVYIHMTSEVWNERYVTDKIDDAYYRTYIDICSFAHSLLDSSMEVMRALWKIGLTKVRHVDIFKTFNARIRMKHKFILQLVVLGWQEFIFDIRPPFHDCVLMNQFSFNFNL